MHRRIEELKEQLDEPLLNQVIIPISAPTRSSGSSRGIYQAFENQELRNRNKELLAKFSKKRNRERIYKFIVKNQGYFYVAVPLIIGGGAGLLEYFFGSYQNYTHLLETLNTQKDSIFSNYTQTQCPGDEYWRHPEEAVYCKGAQGEMIPEKGHLLKMENYCFIKNCDLSDFVRELKKHLPIVCMPIMEMFCNVVQEIFDCEGDRLQDLLATIAIPFFLTILSLFLVSRVVKIATAMTAEEQADVYRHLEEFDLPQPEGPLQLEYVVSHFNILEERAKIYDAVLNELDELFDFAEDTKKGIVTIILLYANLIPRIDLLRLHTQYNAISRSLIFDEEKTDTIRTSLLQDDSKKIELSTLQNDDKKLNLSTLFARIPTEQVTHHRLKNGTVVPHNRKGLTPSDVAEKIFNFAGLSAPA